MTDEYGVNDWFRCPCCAESADDGRLRISLGLGFGNVSLRLRCRNCGFSHTARDWRNQNLKRSIRLRRWFRQAFLTHPLQGATIHDAAKCAACTARGHVHVELGRETTGPDRNPRNEAALRVACEDCGETYEHTLTHPDPF